MRVTKLFESGRRWVVLAGSGRQGVSEDKARPRGTKIIRFRCRSQSAPTHPLPFPPLLLPSPSVRPSAFPAPANILTQRNLRSEVNAGVYLLFSLFSTFFLRPFHHFHVHNPVSFLPVLTHPSPRPPPCRSSPMHLSFHPRQHLKDPPRPLTYLPRI